MFISHNDAQLYTVSFGSGPHTILAMGGWAGSWEVWTETFCTLSESWRTAAYDHRGTGASIAPVESISVETLTQDVFAVMDALHIDRCVLAAESAGAVVALNAILGQPERFQGLVIVDGLYYSPMPDETDPFVQGLKHYFEATIAQFINRCVPEPNSEAIRRWGRQILSRSEQAAAIRLYECMYGVDLRPRFHEIKQPALVIHGTHDQLVSVEAAQWLAAELPDAQLKILEGAGHVPTVTRPRDVAEAIKRWAERF